MSLFAANDPDRLYWTGGIDDPASGWLLEYFDSGDGMFVQLALLPYSPRSFNRAPFDLSHRIRQVNNPVDEVPIGDWSNEVIW